MGSPFILCFVSLAKPGNGQWGLRQEIRGPEPLTPAESGGFPPCDLNGVSSCVGGGATFGGMDYSVYKPKRKWGYNKIGGGGERFRGRLISGNAGPDPRQEPGLWARPCPWKPGRLPASGGDGGEEAHAQYCNELRHQGNERRLHGHMENSVCPFLGRRLAHPPFSRRLCIQPSPPPPDCRWQMKAAGTASHSCSFHILGRVKIRSFFFTCVFSAVLRSITIPR